MKYSYQQLISIENLFQAGQEFKKGKRNKKDVQFFERHLEDNLFKLHHQLASKTYGHGTYHEFYVNDPKRRHIHKANVFDRIVHHLLYKHLYDLFDKSFIYDSYSCRLEKGTHKAIRRLERFTRIVSKNYTHDCWALKLDIRKFFASVDHEILKRLIEVKVKDREILRLINLIIDSFPVGVKPLKGIPLGNLTSQIFANIYLNELDQFIKHKLKIKHYLRYADDFIILDSSKNKLLKYINIIKLFLADRLSLELHPGKIVLRKLMCGLDFCGYIVLPHYILPRAKTRRRIFNKISNENITNESIQSYLGYFSHASSFKLMNEMKNIFWLTTKQNAI